MALLFTFLPLSLTLLLSKSCNLICFFLRHVVITNQIFFSVAQYSFHVKTPKQPHPSQMSPPPLSFLLACQRHVFVGRRISNYRPQLNMDQPAMVINARAFGRLLASFDLRMGIDIRACMLHSCCSSCGNLLHLYEAAK